MPKSLDRLPALEAALERGGGQILVGFQYRFHPAFNRAHEIIQAGGLGDILSAHAHWGEYLPDWHPWEDYRAGYAARADLGGGVLRTLTHSFDYLRHLVGEISALWAFSSHVSPLELDVEDAAEIGLRFVEGALGGLHLNYFQRPPVHNLEIAGTKGTLRWDSADNVLHLLEARPDFGDVSDRDSAPVVENFSPDPGFERNDLFLAEMKHFIHIVRDEAAPACTLADGVRALELALAAKRSTADLRAVAWPQPGAPREGLL